MLFGSSPVITEIARKCKTKEDENRRLKRIVAQQVLDIDALKDLLSKKSFG